MSTEASATSFMRSRQSPSITVLWGKAGELEGDAGKLFSPTGGVNAHARNAY
jgi:hypothetical protein